MSGEVAQLVEADRVVWLVASPPPRAPSPGSIAIVVILLAVLMPLLGLVLGLAWIASTHRPPRTGWRVTMGQRGLTVAWVPALPDAPAALDGIDGRSKALRWDQIAAVGRGPTGRIELLRVDGVRVALPRAPAEVEVAWASAIREHLRLTAAAAQPEAEARQARARLRRLTER